MKIHLLSDAHLGGQGIPLLPKFHKGDVCVIAGDMAALKSPRIFTWYIKELQKRFKHIIMVMGNHEYYGGSIAEGLERAKKLSDELGFILMDVQLGTENLELNGVTFWGSTLWTDLNKGDFFARNAFTTQLNDPKCITDMSAGSYVESHLTSVSKINWDADIVISHHRPIFRKHSDFEIAPTTYSFCCTELEEQIYDSNIKYWFHGHTHDNVLVDVGGTKVVSNQIQGSMGGADYDPKFMVEM